MTTEKKESLFIRLGGREILDKVHKIFYDKVFADAWMKQFFVGVDQQYIEKQQSDFMMGIMGGDRNAFNGRTPRFAHEHIYITSELYDYRHQMLADSLKEAGVKSELAQEWLQLDDAFRIAMIKKSPSEVKKRYLSDQVLIIDPPASIKKKAS